MVVVAAVDLARVRARLRQLDRRRPAELAAPNDQRLVQHAAGFQIRQQSADRLVALTGQPAMVDFDVVVTVPRLALPVPDLHEPHAAFDKPPGNQDLPRLRAGPIHVEYRPGARG